MRILITNDDGINAPGLKVLEAIAAEIAGADGEVWIVAPAFEQSGVAHCISYAHPFLITELAPRRFAAEGAPADCVLAALYEVMTDMPPDLVLSGVNRGNNAGENVMYSGTIGAAIEASLQGVPAIAMSQFFGPENASLDSPFEAAAQHGAGVVRALLDRAPWDETAYPLFYNVNFPPVPAADVVGTTVAAQGRRPGTKFSVTAQTSPTGRRFLWAKGGAQAVASAQGTDVAANLDGYITITPMRADMTAHDALTTTMDALT